MKLEVGVEARGRCWRKERKREERKKGGRTVRCRLLRKEEGRVRGG